MDIQSAHTVCFLERKICHKDFQGKGIANARSARPMPGKAQRNIFASIFVLIEASEQANAEVYIGMRLGECAKAAKSEAKKCSKKMGS
jgi:hypothetical protein